MDKRLIFGIVIAIVIIVCLGAYVGTQNQESTQLNLANASNGTTDSSSVNSSANQNSGNQANNNGNSSKQTVKAKTVICPACHGTGVSYCMGCQGTGVETCTACGGDGKINLYNPNTKKWVIISCSKCGGDGKITCTVCGGSSGKAKCGACGGDGHIDSGDKGYSGQQ